ncbi:hypothetical protein XM38_048400 [Halomicronema hongdechloris C2206]|uniref:Uncharacterized protein n=1 Tax=Halomicronema hongdechloris C2206 TaxID=1641165 RepID=A0A1Z3HUB0_9CYAN|nr:hypothetical protein [Halomicronema hongdechloris]ASC73866.1 hypothetical protein XM38_048400 [Halomicronema hongdechloris C2206]
MANQPLTVIAPIRSGEEPALRQVLDAIATDLTGNPYLQIAKSQKTHFLRLAIIADPEYGQRLLMTGNYDGSLPAYLQELVSLSPDMDALWSKCDGYGGRASFESFIKAHSCRAQAAYIAIQGETVGSIRKRLQIRRTLEDLLDQDTVADYLDQPGLKPLLNALFSLKRPLTLWQALALVGARFWQLIERLIGGICHLIRQIILRILRFVGGILGAPEKKRLAGEYIGVNVDFERLRTLQRPEVVHGINHLHLLSTVRRGRLLRLRIVLCLIHFAARNLFPPGSLSNIRSIHFAHWAIVDGGKHLLFVTHYDGSFDNYLGDFADRASDGLNSIWNNVAGYPQAGAVDIVAFKQFFRNDQQLPSQVFYRAYPEATVATILRDRTIVQPLADELERPEVETWLSRL